MISHSTAMHSHFLVSLHFFMKERMVAMEGEYGAWERIEMMSNCESRVRFMKSKLSVAQLVVCGLKERGDELAGGGGRRSDQERN